MFFLDELLLKDLVDLVRDLLSAGDREDVVSEDLQTVVEYVQRQRVQETDLGFSVSDQFCKNNRVS